MGDYETLTETHEVRESLEDADGIKVLKVVHVEAAHDPADPDSAASALLPFERPYQ